jgi:hypothetical protein
MTPKARLRWIRICGVAGHSLARNCFSERRGSAASHGPWLGTGALPWLFLGDADFCLAWSQPLLVAATLMVVSGLLEGLQALTPVRHPNLTAALYGAGGALVAGLLAELLIRVRRRRPPEARKIH